MKRKFLILLIFVITLSSLMGCAEDSLHSLEKEYEIKEVAYNIDTTFKEEEILVLYEYVEKMFKEDLTRQDIYENKEMYNLFEKYNNMEYFPNNDLEELTNRLLIIIMTMNGQKNFIKSNKVSLQKLKEQFKILQ